jgi:hypothetical protein
MTQMPEHARLAEFSLSVQRASFSRVSKMRSYSNELFKWYQNRSGRFFSGMGFDLLANLLAYDPALRMTARDALSHKYWDEEPKVTRRYVGVDCAAAAELSLLYSAFPENLYPLRKISRAC